ncbi:MAG: DinB family protein [Bacteroidota bacterium]
MNDKIIAAEFIKELDIEFASTLKCVERFNMDLFSWKPHEKSMEMGYLTCLVAEIPLWIAHIVTDGVIDFLTFKHMEPKSIDELVQNFKDNVTAAKKALSAVEEGTLEERFILKRGDEILMETSKKENVATSINHMVHHRGQLTVYMRLNDIAVPSIYGPSADEKTF